MKEDDIEEVGEDIKAGVESHIVQSETESQSGVKSCFCSVSRVNLSSKEISEKGEEERDWVGEGKLVGNIDIFKP